MFLGRLLNEYWDNHPHPYAYPTCNVSNDRSRIFQDIWRDMPIFALSRQKLSSVGSRVSSHKWSVSCKPLDACMNDRWNSGDHRIRSASASVCWTMQRNSCHLIIFEIGIAILTFISEWYRDNEELVREERQFCDFNWLPWQSPLSDIPG